MKIPLLFCVLGATTLWSSTRVASADDHWGDLTVQFTCPGFKPVIKPVKVDKEAWCMKHEIHDERVIVRDGRVANVCLWLERSKDIRLPIHKSFAELRKQRVVLAMEKCCFTPHALLCFTEQEIVIRNNDDVGHIPRFESFNNPGISPLSASNANFTVTMRAAERGPVPVTCNIHPWMLGWSLILDHPYAGISDTDGVINIKNIPVGEWTFHLWHEQQGNIVRGTFRGEPAEWPKGRMQLKIQPGENDLGEIQLDRATLEAKK